MKEFHRGWIALAVADLLVIGYTLTAYLLHRGLNAYFLSIGVGALFARTWQPAVLVSVILIIVTIILVSRILKNRKLREKLDLSEEMEMTESGKIKTAAATLSPKEEPENGEMSDDEATEVLAESADEEATEVLATPDDEEATEALAAPDDEEATEVLATPVDEEGTELPAGGGR